MNLSKAADLVEEQGRFGDTELVHLNPIEVKMLENMTPGGKLTRNPVTGKKEAFWPIVAAIATVVSAGAGIASSKKAAKAKEKADQEAMYIAGAAPVIPESNQLEISPIGDDVPAEMAAPDFRQALAETYGGDMYESPQFQGEQIPPELIELLQQQQMTGAEPTNVQFARSGGPVGLPQDVYNFPVEKISQMQMDVDPGVRNVGNAMRAQMEANPGMGMVSASAADIDQMAAGGPVQPKKYQDGSDGGLDIFAMLDQTARAEGRPTGGEMELEYLREMMNEPSVEKLTKEELLRETEIDLMERNVGGRKDRELERLRREGLKIKRDKEALPDIPPQAVPMSPNVMKTILEKQGMGSKTLQGIEQVLGRVLPTQGYSERRGYDDGPLIQEQGLDFRSAPEERVPFAQYKIFEERFGPGESRLERLLENLDGERVKSLFKRKERPVLGPQMRNNGGSVRPKKYQEGSEGGIGELYKKIPTNLRLFGEYLAGVESPITEKDFTEDELDVIRNQIIAQKINNEVLEDEYRKAGDADAVETFEKTRGRTSVSPYTIQESGLPTSKTTFGRSYISGGSGAVDKGWEEALKSLNDPSYMVATTLGKYTAEDVDDGFRIREDYDFNRGASDRPSPIQDIESFDQLKNLLATMQATPEVVGETLANMIRSEPRAVDIRL